MKLKTVYICSRCRAQSSRWAGRCSGCGEWNTLVEDAVNVGKASKKPTLSLSLNAPVSTADFVPEERLKTGIGELDRVLGGGFVGDAVVLLVGDPGIGKSTLTLQVCDAMAGQSKRVFYFSGEESVGQISARAKRLGLKHPVHVLNLNHLESALVLTESEKPDFVVVDSVQVMESEEVESHAGSLSQVRLVAERLMQAAKSLKIPVLLIGHVNKEGQLAGPQVLTHLVDTVLYLEGDAFHQFRLLRATKNRFGAVDEVGVFSMEEEGMNEVKNPSELFLSGRAKNPVGSAVFPVMEGTRPFLVEVQALTSYTQFGYPRRTASGFDLNRLNIIIAVLNRYAKLSLDSSDVFVNIAGGLKLKEPAADLAVAMAIVSSKLKKPLPADLIVMGELGLSGEVRAVGQTEKRLKEAQKLGFKTALTPALKKALKNGMELAQIRAVADILNKFFVQ